MDRPKKLNDRLWTVLICLLFAVVLLVSGMTTQIIRNQQFELRLERIHQDNVSAAKKEFEVLKKNALMAASIVAQSDSVVRILSQAKLLNNTKTPEPQLELAREELLEYFNDFWPTLQSFGGQQLQAYLAPDGLSLLRVHNPGIFGDIASQRPLIRQVLISKTADAQIEEGKSGISMRAAVPVIANNQLIGVIEVGLSLQSNETKSPVDLQQSTFVFRENTEYKNTKISGTEDVSHLSEWQNEDLFVNQSGILTKLPAIIEGPTYQVLTHEQRHFLVSFIPPLMPKHAKSQPDVAMISWTDVTDAFEGKKRNDWKIAGTWLISLLLGLAMVYFLSRRLSLSATKKLEQQMIELRWSQQKLHALFELSHDAILLNRLADGSYLDANPAMTLMTGYSLEELKQLSYWDLTPSEFEKQEQLRLLNETGRYGPYHKQYRHKNGELVDIELRGVRFNGPNGEPLIWSVITDRRESLKLERMKHAFISNISHELRTPLTSIGGSLDLMLAGAAGELPAKAQKLVQIAAKNNKRLISLVNDLLDIERLSLGKLVLKPEQVDSVQLLRTAVEINQPYAQLKHVKLELGYCESLSVTVDPERLQQVLSNLISNAAKFSPENSVVTLSCKKQHQMMRFEVTDQGPGMTRTEIATLFRRFAQLDNATGGTQQGSGLGLSICKEIIEQSNGQIGVVSAPQSGSSFWFELPLKDQTPSTGISILIIEDDPDTAQTLQKLIQTKNYGSEIASNLAQAWALLYSKHFDLITLDLRLEQENGCDFFLKLRDHENYRNLPVLIVSAFIEHGKLKLDAIANTVDWIEKPVQIDDLVFKIEYLLNRSNNQSSTARILHVEDDEDIVAIIKMQLENKFYYHHAGSLTQARDKIRSHRYDLILLDIGLPDGDGWELLSDMHGMNDNVPIIVFSAQDITVQQKHKATAVFGKTKISPQDLVSNIEKILHS